jgi:hypothetical protein
MSWLYTIVFAGMMLSHSMEPAHVYTNSARIDSKPVVQRSQQNETERIERSFPLNANGRVSISNVNGSINVIAWERNEVKLVAVKTADSKESLANVDIKIDARPDYFSVETDYGDDRTWKSDSDRRWRNNDKVTVEYELSVPRTAMLNEIETVNGSVSLADFTNYVKVSAVNGTVHAGNLRGTADLSTVNGELVADFDRLATGSKIALETVNGRVNLTIPSDSNATLKAESLNGVITNDFGLPNKRGKYVGNSLHGRLGKGEVPITLESVNGSLTVKHRSDGKPLSPATNLLPAKGEDEDGDGQAGVDKQDLERMNRDIDRSVRESQRNALRDAQRENEKLKVEIPKISDDISKQIAKSVDTEKIQRSIKESMDAQKMALGVMRDASFLTRVPRIETKSETFAVKGIPKITVEANGCAVRVRGWDSSEVKYSLTRLKGGMGFVDPKVSESHSDSAVTLKVSGSDSEDNPVGFGDHSSLTRIDVYVPRKSNLKIVSDKEIWLNGVSGELEIIGGDEPLNIRDSDGKLNLTNEDGRVRVIGFDGDVAARTSDGDVYLEGKFSKLVGRADSGAFTVTLPPDANADITTNTDPQSEGFALSNKGSNKWRLGSGGSNYSFDLTDGELTIRNSSVLIGK